MKRFSVLVAAAFTVLVSVTLGANDRPRELKLQQAIDLIESKGDLTKATPLLEDVAKSSDRALAARGLLHLAQAQERYGMGDALATYQRIVSEFGGAAESTATETMVEAARRGAAAITQKSTGLIAQRIPEIRHMSAVSPNGRYMTYGDPDWNLHVQDLRSGRDQKLTACLPSPDFKMKDCRVGSKGVFSPDSRWLAYQLNRTPEGEPKRPYELRIISREGGDSRVIHLSRDIIFPVGWTPDGKSILSWVERSPQGRAQMQELILVPSTGGQPRVIRRVDDQGDRFRLSPDGLSVLYDRPAKAGSLERDLVVVSLESGAELAAFSHPADDHALDWFPKGDRVLFSSDRGGTVGLWAARISRGGFEDEPMLIRGDTGPVNSKGFTDKGWLYYGVIRVDDDLFIATVDSASGKQAGDVKRLDSRFMAGKRAATWSPDGTRIAFVKGPSVAGPRRNVDQTIAIQTVATGAVDELPFILRNLGHPVWTPDGRTLVATGQSEGRQGLFQFDVAARAISLVEAGPQDNVIMSPDGQQIFSIVRRPRPEGSVSVRNTGTGAERILTNEIADRLALSPDGRWLAMSRRISTLSTSRNTVVIPASGGEPRPLANGVRDWSIQAMTFSADGRFLIVVKDARGELGPDREIWQIPMDGSEPRDTGIRWPHNIWQLSAHPDGRRLLISSSAFGPELWVLQNIPPQK